MKKSKGFSELIKEDTYTERELLTVGLIKKYFREVIFSKMPDRLSFIYPPSPPSEEEE